MSALKVRAASEQAFGSSPSRPGQTQGGRASGQGQGHFQEPTHFRDRQFGEFIGRVTFFPSSVMRRLASQAWAIIDKVMCRYQLGQVRTSY